MHVILAIFLSLLLAAAANPFSVNLAMLIGIAFFEGATWGGIDNGNTLYYRNLGNPLSRVQTVQYIVEDCKFKYIQY